MRDIIFWFRRTFGESDGFCAKQTNPTAAYLTAFPISPKDWIRSELGRRLREWRLKHGWWDISGLR